MQRDSTVQKAKTVQYKSELRYNNNVQFVPSEKYKMYKKRES